jgi:hypothetical protein
MLYQQFPEEESVEPPQITKSNFPPLKKNKYKKEINILLAEGFREYLSINTKRPARINIGDHSQQVSYKVKVQAMLTKMPGWFFTAYQTA